MHANALNLRPAAAPIQVLASGWDLGAPVRGAGLGPGALRAAAVQRGLWTMGRIASVGHPDYRPHHFEVPSVHHLGELVAHAAAQASAHAEALATGARTLLLSGDHAGAVGWLAGARRAFPGARLGVVWIDAHGDLHTPYTTPTGNAHGMPLAAALGQDNRACARRTISPTTRAAWAALAGLAGERPALRPEDVFLVDIRDLEPEEWKLLRALRLPHVTAAERARVGIDRVIATILERLRACDVLYVSFDVDALDATLVPGTGTPVAGGLDLADAARLLRALCTLPAFRCLEVAEINPLLDDRNAVAERVAALLAHAWPGLAG